MTASIIPFPHSGTSRHPAPQRSCGNPSRDTHTTPNCHSPAASPGVAGHPRVDGPTILIGVAVLCVLAAIVGAFS